MIMNVILKEYNYKVADYEMYIDKFMSYNKRFINRTAGPYREIQSPWSLA